MDIQGLIQEGKVSLIDKDVLRALLSNQRQDVRRKLVSSAEAMKILGINRTRFYKLLEDPNCKIKKSKILNRYSLDSIYKEVERLVG